MRNLAEVIGFNLLKEKLIESKQLNAKLTESGSEININVSLKGEVTQFKLVNYLWGNLEQVYETAIAAEMLVQGYVLITIPGGWLVYNPAGEDYQIEDQDCTCQDYLYRRKRKSRCKHLVFRDWHLNYRARLNQIKKNLQ